MQVVLKQAGQADRELPAHEDQTILSFLANQGIHLDAPCAGRGTCGKCRVKVSGSVSAPGEAEINTLGGATGERLACQTKLTGPAVVEISAQARFSSVKGLGESEPYEVDSPLKMVALEPGGRQDNTDLLTKSGSARSSIRALNQLAELDIANQPGWAIKWDEELLAALPRPDGGPGVELLAAAIDLGTTGLAVAIIDVIKGEVVAQGTALNPQTSRGGDVISRITWSAEEPGNLAHLQNLALDGLARLILETIGPERRTRIMAAVISANTTMTHLLAGVEPHGLALSPYRPVFIKSLDLSNLADNLGLNPQAKVFTLPCISAYVGGDITAGVMAVGLKKRPGTILFIDIGTNGEIVLSHQGRLVATSCAAGPALEGMNITCGQRATPGAVDSFSLTADYQYKFTTIAEATATGICGSGLIDLTAALVTHGLIDSTGRLKPPAEIPASAPWLAELSEGRFTLSGKVFFDQKDIRQVQLAKGAIGAAVEMLLDHLGLTTNDLDEIIIAGAFGFHLRTESLKAINLIPSTYEGPVRFVGNSSLAGAARALLAPTALGDLNRLAEETTVNELGFDPRFQEIFVRHLKF